MTTFNFGAPYHKRPAKLSGAPPYIHPHSRERMKEALAVGCACKHDGERTASLTRRNGAAWLQCDACGHSLGNAMRRDHHPQIMAYPTWRIDLIEQYDVVRKEYLDERRSAIFDAFPTLTNEERAEKYRQRSLEYDYWCRTSPEWKAIKEKIFWRSRGHCEACLNGNAEVVHHISYQFGKLPPAWHLKAVCGQCHEKLHCAGDDWCDYGMARDQE